MRKLDIPWAIAAILFAGSLLIGYWALGVYQSANDDGYDRYPVTWQLASSTTSESRSVELLILDDNRCASGVPVSQRLRPPQVSYGSHSVTITLDAEVTSGFHTCPKPIGPGVNNTTVTLKEPLGDRKLIDGHSSDR